MAADNFAASLAARSDAELVTLSKDPSLTSDQWAAIEAEQFRRASAGNASAGASRPLAASAGTNAMPTDGRLAVALQQLRSLLLPGETLDAWAAQERLFALTHRRVIVAATSGRFIALTRGLFGGYVMNDVRWQDLRDASLRAGIFGADLVITSLAVDDLASREAQGSRAMYIGLNKQQAAAVYRLAQAQEQNWREKRRVRDLDELRAKSGGMQFASGGPSVGGAGGEDAVTRLKRAKEMLDGGLITDAEFQAIKAKVVEGL